MLASPKDYFFADNISQSITMKCNISFHEINTGQKVLFHRSIRDKDSQPVVFVWINTDKSFDFVGAQFSWVPVSHEHNKILNLCNVEMYRNHTLEIALQRKCKISKIHEN